jgi:F-type H+-transporting ATPase subunit b
MSLLSAESLSTVLNFCVVVFILWYVGRKPIAEFFASRSSAIARAVDEAKLVSQSAASSLGEWQSAMDQSSAELEKQRNDAKNFVAKLREETKLRIALEAKRIAADGVLLASAETAKVKRSLRKEVALRSIEQAKAFLDHHVENKDTKALLADYLERVGHGHAG